MIYIPLMSYIIFSLNFKKMKPKQVLKCNSNDVTWAE